MGAAQWPGEEEPEPALICLAPLTWLILHTLQYPSKDLAVLLCDMVPWLRITSLEVFFASTHSLSLLNL